MIVQYFEKRNNPYNAFCDGSGDVDPIDLEGFDEDNIQEVFDVAFEWVIIRSNMFISEGTACGVVKAWEDTDAVPELIDYLKGYFSTKS